jgi:hypothetical protein
MTFLATVTRREFEAFPDISEQDAVGEFRDLWGEVPTILWIGVGSVISVMIPS